MPSLFSLKRPCKLSTQEFRFCCAVWGCAGLTEVDRLRKLLNRAARIVTNSSFDAPNRTLIKGLWWKTVEELASGESKTMVFKSLNKLAPQYLCDLFTRNSLCSSYRLRNTGTDLRLPMKRSNNGQKCFPYRGAKIWNSLPADSKQALSVSFQKNHLEAVTFSFRFYCQFWTLLYIKFRYCK